MGITVLLISLFCFSPFLFAQDEQGIKEEIKAAVNNVAQEKEGLDEEALSGAVSEGYERALRKIESEKRKKERVINTRLDKAVKGWIDMKNEQQKEKINYKIEQDLYKPPDTYPFASKTSPYYGATKTMPSYTDRVLNLDRSTVPLYHLRYYLRDFAYSKKSSVVKETSFLVYPYEAVVDIREDLFVEQAPLVNTPRSRFQHTVETDMSLTLQYHESSGQWRVLNIERKRAVLKKTWPDKIKRKLPTYFIPQD
jgi:hypothetical protein